MEEGRSSPGQSWLTALLCSLVEAAQRRARLTVSVCLVLTVVFGVYAASNISFNVDPNAFFSEDLRFQHAIVEFEQYFPVLTNSLLVVVDGVTPERTREAAEILVPALDEQRDVFHRAFLPGEDRFFERHGLLYGTLDEVYDFSDHMVVIQPVLAELARDPSLPTLTDVLRKGLDAVNDGEVSGEGWEMVFDHLRTASGAVREGDVDALSWESVLITGTGFEPTTRTLVVAEPILDLERILAAERGIEAVRETAERLGLVPEQGIEIRITGYPALNHEEMTGLATDTSAAGTLSFVLVILVLFHAFRSPFLVLAAAITLIMGLVWAAAFSAATVKVLNPVSITFGVLVIGLGIDFMIHLGMHFVEALTDGESVEAAIPVAMRKTGAALVLCAGTTGVGFLAFIPTDFIGISDLGLAAAGGMVSILILTLTLFPALIQLMMRPVAVARLLGHGPAKGIPIPRPGRPGVVVAVSAALGGMALFLVSSVDLEANVISMRNQSTESVQAFKALLGATNTTPWFLDALTPSLDRAVELAEQMRGLPTVDQVITLADYVPIDQEEKLAVLSDTSLMMGLSTIADRRVADPALQHAALRQLRDYLASEPLNAEGPLAESVREFMLALDEFLGALEGERDGRVADLAAVLLDPIPAQIRRLQANLEVGEITQADLPAGLVERMLAKDGHARIQVYPSDDLWDHHAMTQFVESIRSIWSEITGLPVNLVESARATWDSLRLAVLFSTGAITLLLLLLWRRIGNTAIVLIPLLLAVLLTQVSTVVLPVSFNFANVLVLPLLIGIGVDSGIHLVQRAEHLRDRPGHLLETTTARAVLLSALTTVSSFGTLMISEHRGVSSLGVLLVIGMIWTLAANLCLLPALLEMRERRRSGRESS